MTFGGDDLPRGCPRECGRDISENHLGNRVVSVFLDAFGVRRVFLPQNKAAGSMQGLCAVLEGTLGDSVTSPSLIQQCTREYLLL